MELARHLQALTSGRRTTDLRPDEHGAESSSDPDALRSVDEATTELLLDNNALTSLPFGRLQLGSLRTLSLSSNRLTTLEPDIASFAASLRVLKLECNVLRRLPDALCALGRLEALWLGYNELESCPRGSASSAGCGNSASTPTSCASCRLQPSPQP